jgi:hypothetical protein
MGQFNNPEFNHSVHLLNQTQNAMFSATHKMNFLAKDGDTARTMHSVTGIHLLAYRRAINALVTDSVLVSNLVKAAAISALWEHVSTRRAEGLNFILGVEGFGTDYEIEDVTDLRECLDNRTRAGSSPAVISESITKPFEAELAGDIAKIFAIITPDQTI